jgi:hypothetical protein
MDSKCILGDVDIRLCLRDIRRIRGSHASIWSMARLVDNIFACISGNADRRRSSKFDLSTENPIVFRRVQVHCSVLRTPHPTTLKLAYVYMPGYSPLRHAIFLRNEYASSLPRPYETVRHFSELHSIIVFSANP